MAELQLYSVREVAEILRITRHGVYELIRAGKLKACRFTERRTRIKEQDLNEFIQKSRRHQHDPVHEKIVASGCDCP